MRIRLCVGSILIDAKAPKIRPANIPTCHKNMRSQNGSSMAGPFGPIGKVLIHGSEEGLGKTCAMSERDGGRNGPGNNPARHGEQDDQEIAVEFLLLERRSIYGCCSTQFISIEKVWVSARRCPTAHTQGVACIELKEP